MLRRARTLLLCAAAAAVAYSLALASAGAAFALFLGLGMLAELRFWVEVVRGLRTSRVEEQGSVTLKS